MHEPGLETLGHMLRGPFPGEHTGEASHAAPHGIEAAAVHKLCRRGHP